MYTLLLLLKRCILPVSWYEEFNSSIVLWTFLDALFHLIKSWFIFIVQLFLILFLVSISICIYNRDLGSKPNILYLFCLLLFIFYYYWMKSLLFVSALCMPWHFSWLVVSLVYCDLTCSSGQTYVKFVKKCGSSWASEESFKVYDGSTLLYTGSNFANSETRTIEQCLPSSTNNQYTVELIDSYGDSWCAGSYLSIFGRFGNVIFKNMLVDPN